MSNDRQQLHPEVPCQVELGDNMRSKMKMSDVERLAMLRAKAKSESGNFSCVDFFKGLLFIGVVSTFAFVFYRISALQIEVDSLSSRFEVMRSVSQSEAIRRLTRPCNCSVPAFRRHGDRRYRRSVSETQQESEDAAPAPSNGIDYQIPSYNDRFSAHLLLTESNTTLMQGDIKIEKVVYWLEHCSQTYSTSQITTFENFGQLFNWTNTKNNSFLQPGGFELLKDHYLFVPVAGYYFVYSQITFNDSLTRTIGHQVVKWGRCGSGVGTLLMGSSLTQQARPATDLSNSKKDSTYLGGVVYLSAGDHVGVRPDFGSTKSIDFARLDTNSYFGAFIVNRDMKGRSLKENCI